MRLNKIFCKMEPTWALQVQILADSAEEIPLRTNPKLARMLIEDVSTKVAIEVRSMRCQQCNKISESGSCVDGDNEKWISCKHCSYEAPDAELKRRCVLVMTDLMNHNSDDPAARRAQAE